MMPIRAGRIHDACATYCMAFRNTSCCIEGIFVHLELFAVLFLFKFKFVLLTNLFNSIQFNKLYLDFFDE
jgi:hypothetical protein